MAGARGGAGAVDHADVGERDGGGVFADEGANFGGELRRGLGPRECGEGKAEEDGEEEFFHGVTFGDAGRDSNPGMAGTRIRNGEASFAWEER